MQLLEELKSLIPEIFLGLTKRGSPLACVCPARWSCLTCWCLRQLSLPFSQWLNFPRDTGPSRSCSPPREGQSCSTDSPTEGKSQPGCLCAIADPGLGRDPGAQAHRWVPKRGVGSCWETRARGKEKNPYFVVNGSVYGLLPFETKEPWDVLGWKGS